MLGDFVRLAYKGVKQRKLRSWLTMIGIFIGIAAVVALISLSQGLQQAVSQQFLSLGTDKLVVQAEGGGFGPPGTAVPDHLDESDKKAIEKAKGVDLVVGRLIRQIEIDYKDSVRYTFAVTIPSDTAERDLVIEANNYKLVEGNFPKKGSKEVMIGSNIAKNFFDDEVELRSKLKIQDEEFKVVGILQKSGNPQQDDTFVLPEKSFRDILNIPSDYDIIPLRVHPGEDVEIVAENVRKELRKHRNVKEGKEDFTVETPQQIIGILNNILTTIQGVLVGIAGISLIVGGIGIMNTMYTSVVERTREIGLLKAVGATQNKILTLFVVEAGLLGLAGGVIGVSIGFIGSKLVEVIAVQVFGSALIKANATPSLLIGALLFSFFIGALSGFLPARQAAKLHPVEALRK